MKPEQTHINQIRAIFEKMQSKEDLLYLLNKAKPLIYGNKTVPFELKQLTWYANPKVNDRRYVEFKIKKKSGQERSIHAPVNGLKSLQKTLSFVLQCVFEPHSAAMGFVRDKSIVDNARIHEYSRYVYCIDLKDFFSSFDQARIWKCLQLRPFNLKGELKILLANIIAVLCCTEMEVERRNEDGEWKLQRCNVLPQGAPTSPVITNIVCQRLDYLLSGVAKRFGLKYSRYADDITFSSMHDVYQPESDFLKELQRIITEQGFCIRQGKTRLQKDGYRKEVTGLLVDKKVNVQKRYIKQLRMWLYYWERYGYDRAYPFFLQLYLHDKGHIVRGNPDMTSVIGGKLDYLRMVKGDENELYLKLKARFKALTTKNELKKGMVNQLSSLETEGPSFVQARSEIKGQIRARVVESSDLSTPEAKKEKLSIPIKHNPKELVNLLKKFSVNDSALKYTTHSWDAGRDANMFKDLSGFLSLAKKQYNDFSFQLQLFSRNLHGKINAFLFNEKISEIGWGDANPARRIYFGWSSPELLEACKLDVSLNPEDFILPEKYQLQRAGKTLQKFKHIIDVFKNEIEIRDENSALENLILQKHDAFLLSFTAPTIVNLDDKTFYTDVQWLSKALDLIFEGIQSRPQHREIRYTIKDERKDVLTLEILHVNSFNAGKSIKDEKFELKKGNFGDISKYLKNLCDWSIESEFAEGCFRINYLTSKTNDVPYQKVESAEGFKHILTFYK